MPWLEDQQRLQFAHDGRNHQDIHCLARRDRLIHYGLHFGKYCGRLARNDMNDPHHKTLVDWLLVTLSAATALQDPLPNLAAVTPTEFRSSFPKLCDATGRFCDACARLDGLGEFRDLAVKANRDIVRHLLGVAENAGLDLDSLLAERRRQLARRAFYVTQDDPRPAVSAG